MRSFNFCLQMMNPILSNFEALITVHIVRKDVGKDLLVFLGLLWHYLNTVSVWFSLSLFRDPSARKGIHRKYNSKRFAILMKFTHFHAGIISIISSNVSISAHHNCYTLFTVHELTTKKRINTFLALKGYLDISRNWQKSL